MDAIDEVLDKARKLSSRDKLRVIERLSMDVREEIENGSRKRCTIKDWIGAGAHIWRGVDIDAYINDLRESWES